MGKIILYPRKSFIERLAELNEKIKNPPFKPKTKQEIIQTIIDTATYDKETLLNRFQTSITGLTYKDHKKRLRQYGFNEVAHEKKDHWILRLLKIVANPLIGLLIFIIVISLLTKDFKTTYIVSIMILASITLRFVQEDQAYNSAESLRSLVKTTCTVIRNGKSREIELRYVVPGDVIELSAGDIIPADLRIIESKELFVNQSALTGESLPVEKHAATVVSENPLGQANICFMGTNVESGHALGVIIQTGSDTYFGVLAKTIGGYRTETSFDKGINRFTWLMITFMLFMVPLVFLINGLTKNNWFEAFLFSISVAVGLTPEMLPALITLNLSKGAIAMAEKKVIIKRLSSIQNFGAMNVLCTDKTGTLTLNKIVLIDNIDIRGKTDKNVLYLAYINSAFQTGFKNLLDSAVIKHAKENNIHHIVNNYSKIDELPFDFKRRRLSVITEDQKKEKMLICKGAIEEIVSICEYYEVNGEEYHLDSKAKKEIEKLNKKYSNDGFRIIAVAHKHIDAYTDRKVDIHENNLVFSGLMTFFDPPKESAFKAVKDLIDYGVEVKILTGDNELVTRKIAKDVGITINGSLLGIEIEKMNEKDLQQIVGTTTIFAKLSPEDKKRVIEALKQTGHTVGFLGDGINDAPGLRAADVGISVNGAVDIAKESADIVLLEMSLSILVDGVIEGRRVFGNIIKYIKMGASSNFGNMFSVLGGSLFLRFLPMLPIQILVNNLLYNFSQTAIPLDNVDKEYIEKPRQWQIKDIARYIIFMGPISSVFDYLTFLVMLYIFNAWNNPALFQTGWFVESLITQTLIVHVIRSRKIPFFQSWSSPPLIIATVLVIFTGIFLTMSTFAKYFNFVRLPALYWPILTLLLLGYIFSAQIMKSWYMKKFGYN